MKYFICLFNVVLLLQSCSAQMKKMSIQEFEKYGVPDLQLKLDSTIEKVNRPVIEFYSFDVKLSEVYFDRSSKKIILKGKTCMGNNCTGIPIEIFKIQRNEKGSLNKFEKIGESSSSNNAERGIFDIVVALQDGESIVFYV